HPSWVVGGLEDRDVAAHRVAHQDDGFTDDLLYELIDKRGVGADRRGPMEERRLSKAGEVDRKGVVALCQLRSDGHPVQRIAAQSVDHEERFALPSEVDVVDRPVEVGDFMSQCVNPTMPGSGWRPPNA